MLWQKNIANYRLFNRSNFRRNEMENYRILPIASVVLQVLAWIGLVLGVISAAIAFLGIDKSAPTWMGIISLIAGSMYFFLFIVGSEAIKLLLDIHKKVSS